MPGRVAKRPENRTVPAYLLVGFLGSGKTTLLGKLISWCIESGFKPGLIINEFGAAWIDSQTVRQEGMPLSEISGGCVCCTADEDLIPALTDMAANPEVDLILVEASGLADPADILDELTDPMLWEWVEVGGVISVVDASRFRQLIEITELAQRQVEYADLLILNKCDLVQSEDRAALEKQLAELAPQAKIFPAEGGLPYAGVEAILAYSLQSGRKGHQLQPQIDHNLKTHAGAAYVEPMPAHEHSYAQLSVHTLQFDLEQPLNKANFELFLKNLPPTVYRAKGFVKIQDDPRPHIFQHMPGFTKVLPFERSQIPTWRGVFIGQDMDESWLATKLAECRVK